MSEPASSTQSSSKHAKAEKIKAGFKKAGKILVATVAIAGVLGVSGFTGYMFGQHNECVSNTISANEQSQIISQFNKSSADTLSKMKVNSSSTIDVNGERYSYYLEERDVTTIVTDTGASTDTQRKEVDTLVVTRPGASPQTATIQMVTLEKK